MRCGKTRKGRRLEVMVLEEKEMGGSVSSVRVQRRDFFFCFSNPEAPTDVTFQVLYKQACHHGRVSTLWFMFYTLTCEVQCNYPAAVLSGCTSDSLRLPILCKTGILSRAEHKDKHSN